MHASHNPGYTFVNWTENGSPVSTDPDYQFIITADRNLVGNFVLDTHTVSTSVNPPGSGTATGASQYNYGDLVTMGASPSTGYHFVNWTEGGSPVSYDPGYSFSITTDRTLVANFDNTYTVLVSADPLAGGNVSGSALYTYGDTATIGASSNAGYRFAYWTESGLPVSADPNYSFTVTTARTLVGNFVKTYVISTSVSPPVGGTVSGDGTYDEGATVQMHANPNIGYYFLVWTENGVDVSTDPNYSFNATADRTLVGVFKQYAYTVSASANPVAGGTVSGDGDYAYGSGVTMGASPNLGYRFVNWTENGSPVSTDPGYSFTATNDRTLVGKFVLNTHTMNVTPNPVAGGTVTGNGTYNYGDTCTLTAIPNPGYHFVNWTEGGYESSVNPLSFPVKIDHNGEANFAINTPTVTSVSPPYGPPGVQVTITGTDFLPTQGGSTITIGGNIATVISWSDTEIVVLIPDDTPPGPQVVVVKVNGESSNDNKKYDVTSQNSTWYLAEGTTAWGFSTYITIENPINEEQHARVTYMNSTARTGAGKVAEKIIALPALSQTTITNDAIISAMGGQSDFSTKIESVEKKTIAVDRTMTWTGKETSSSEGHNSIGVASPANNWYLPEGSSAWEFETWTLVQNPNATEANVTLTYMTEDAGPKVLNKKIPAYSRATYSMVEDVGVHDSSIKVTSDVPVIAERSQYRNNRREGSCSIGAIAPAKDYFLSEGTTAWGFTTYVLVQNPNNEATDVTLTYMTQDGAVKQPAFAMPANSRKTIRVNDVSPANGYPIDMSNTDFSVQATGTKPIIAERAMYWDNGTGEACHDSIGLWEPHATFYLPDGQTGNGYETWTLVQNPNSTPVTVSISYLTPTGQGNVTKNETVPANSRRTYSLLAHSGINGRAATMVQSTDPTKKIMVERSMYWNNRGAGTDTIGGYSD